MIEKTKIFSNFFEKGVDKWKLASYNLKFGKKTAQSLSIRALSRFVYIGYTGRFS